MHPAKHNADLDCFKREEGMYCNNRVSMHTCIPTYIKLIMQKWKNVCRQTVNKTFSNGFPFFFCHTKIKLCADFA